MPSHTPDQQQKAPQQEQSGQTRIPFSSVLKILAAAGARRERRKGHGTQTPIVRLDHKIKREQRRQFRYLVAAAVLVFAAGVVFLASRPTPGGRRDLDVLVAISACAVLAIAAFGAAQDKRKLIKRLEEDLREMEFEEELEKTDNGQPEKRAEKLLSIHQHQLRRYYEQNLSQNAWIFVVGVLCLGSGLALVGVTLWLLASRQVAEAETRWLVAAVGGLGSVLTNYVAAVYLKMHAAATATLTGFHGRLASTHELFFANVLASRTSAERRDDVTCQIALAIVQGTRRPDAEK